MKLIFKISFLLAVSIMFSCEKYHDFPGCYDCLEEEPDRAQLKFKFEPSYGVIVDLKVYEGEISDSILIATYLLSNFQPNYKLNVALNKKYSATGTYVINKKKYIVVSGTTIGVIYEKDRCDNPCYYIYGDMIDLKLKSTY